MRFHQCVICVGVWPIDYVCAFASAMNGTWVCMCVLCISISLDSLVCAGFMDWSGSEGGREGNVIRIEAPRTVVQVLGTILWVHVAVW